MRGKNLFDSKLKANLKHSVPTNISWSRTSDKAIPRTNTYDLFEKKSYSKSDQINLTSTKYEIILTSLSARLLATLMEKHIKKMTKKVAEQPA